MTKDSDSPKLVVKRVALHSVAFDFCFCTTTGSSVDPYPTSNWGPFWEGVPERPVVVVRPFSRPPPLQSGKRIEVRG